MNWNDELRVVYDRNKVMPCGGPKLTIVQVEHYWMVTDGQVRYGKWYRKADASKDLRSVGFVSHRVPHTSTVYFHTS